MQTWQRFTLVAALGGLIVVSFFDMLDFTRARNDERQLAAQAAQIADLKSQLADANRKADASEAAFADCDSILRSRADLPAIAPSHDAIGDAPDFVTVIVSQVNLASPATEPPAQSPLVGLANMYHPGLGTALAGLLAPPRAEGSEQSRGVSVTKWVVAGRVTPYIGGSDTALVEYAWINVRTNAMEVHQPEAARVLLARYQQHRGQ